jgi:hypothetical protein
MALPAPAAVLILTNTTREDLTERLEELKGPRKDARIRRIVIQGHIDADLFALASESLLADPGARARLAPKLSPNDIPDVMPELADEAGIGAATRLAWQEAIFDSQGRLVLTPSADDRYMLFRACEQKVNPHFWQLADAFLFRMISR